MNVKTETNNKNEIIQSQEHINTQLLTSDHFKNLHYPFFDKTNFYLLMNLIQNTIIESKEPMKIIHSINHLRILLKFHKDLFVFIFANIHDKFQKILLNENENLSHISLILFSEFFSTVWIEPESKYWIESLISPILILSTSDNKIISSLSLECLDLISKNEYHEETFLLLLNGMSDKSETVTLIASQTLHKFMTNCDRMLLVYSFNWCDIFSSILSLFTIKVKRDLTIGLIKTMQFEIFDSTEFEYILSQLEDSHLQFLISFCNVKIDYANFRNKRLLTNK